MNSATTRLVWRLLELIWLSALGLALVAAALTTERRARRVEENPSYCDPFGYLQMAQEIRQGTATGKAPQFSIESHHSRLLIEYMQSQKVPLPLWDEMVAPLAYHYFPVADHLAVQYPPGAGLMLSAFPEGRALHGLNRLVIVIFLVAGLVMLIVAAVKRLPLAAGLFVVALSLGLEILAQLDNASFSMNALLAPLLLSGLCLSAAWAVCTDNVRIFDGAWFLTLLAGIFFGFAVLARLPVILLLPGVILLLWPGRLRTLPKSAPVVFILGLVLGGLLPLMVHQSRVAGAWYLTTYGQSDVTPPTLARVWSNASYYFAAGKSSTVNWVLPVILVGCLGLICRSSRQQSGGPATFLPGLGWIRLLAAAAVILALSNAYFLTHFPTGHYYPWPALFGAVLLVSLGAFALEKRSSTAIGARAWPRRALLLAGLALSLAPGLIVIARAWSHYTAPTAESSPKQFLLPAELADQSVWVWACELSGTLWYYAHKPAHKVTSTNADTRELVFKFVRDRGEPQYVVTDDPSMQAVADEIIQLGGRLERRGEVDGYPYYLIHWPSR